MAKFKSHQEFSLEQDNMSTLQNPDFQKAFIEGVNETLRMMAELNPVQGEIAIRDQFECQGDVTGMIGMASDHASGTVTISFEKSTLLAIVSKVVGTNLTDLDDMALEGVGELSNMIYGTARAKLNDKGWKFQMALPTVITGDYQVSSLHKGPTLIIPFTVPDLGNLFVEITVHP